ncbi:hypothetical protein M427DRAFT_424878 [Gonapodya prolifera JEL478]|uniref:Uncharacterized protein n=1 Tax=Gonapodya prolifera (strain JEL478) TaxID=1344416 RepID=A0A139A525_GONPJ|nr:hypothetical protein M427DRAFT_424878 [Gonapodya prolifera JEL478]|eukprot:KXS11605.1 hypothetical protein M427DRAFT_424878 [Gonapodya prolifera JEL478]
MLARSFSSLALPQHVAPAALWSTLARSRPLPHPDPNHPTSREFYASLWRGYGHNHGEEKGFTPRNPKKARSSSVNLPPLDSPLMKDRTKPGVADPDFPPTIENVETFLKSFLSSQTICVVATTGKNGVPRATPSEQSSCRLPWDTPISH